MFDVASWNRMNRTLTEIIHKDVIQANDLPSMQSCPIMDKTFSRKDHKHHKLSHTLKMPSGRDATKGISYIDGRVN